MITNISHFCRKTFNPNEILYVEVRNQCMYYINILLIYKIHGRHITKPSPVFPPGKIERVTFPYDALNIRLIVYNCFYNPPTLVCDKSISENIISCYKVKESLHGFLQCIRIEC